MLLSGKFVLGIDNAARALHVTLLTWSCQIMELEAITYLIWKKYSLPHPNQLLYFRIAYENNYDTIQIKKAPLLLQMIINITFVTKEKLFINNLYIVLLYFMIEYIFSIF